jgi:hypothetical protein
MRNGVFFACLSMMLAAPSPCVTAGMPAVTSRDIEADWLRQCEVRTPMGVANPATDAIGGCDGKIDGTWGFHTTHEKQPWWQVDLGQEVSIDRVRLYNRCDGGFATRMANFLLLLSSDGVTFRQAYGNNGTVFYGFSDSKPMDIPLNGASARFVRIQLPGNDFLHLDEVEVYAGGLPDNIALNKPATQSSTSQWSSDHGAGDASFMGVDAVVRRGRALAENLLGLGAYMKEPAAYFETLAARASALPAGADRDRALSGIHWAVRSMALRNPLLDFDEILFVKRAPTMFPHVSDQYYGWFSRGGGGICILSGFKGNSPRVRCLTEGWPEGNFLRPDLSHDGTKVLFAYCRHYPGLSELADKTAKESLPEDAHYHIYEMNIDGTDVRQLTRGAYDDFDARYLPQGDIVFVSTRKGVALQADRDSASATCNAAMPDSYVRCGGDTRRPVPVFTLHRMNPDGENLCAVSAFENFEWTPAVSGDGQVLYARWDYIDRFNGHFMSLWSTHPDGTGAQLVYGNYTVRPQCVFEARPVPGSRRLVFTATAHHSITGGSLVLLDRTLGTEYETPLERITPEVCFPETEGQPKSYYAGPWPLSEDHYLVSWSDRPLPPHTYMKKDDQRNPPNASGIYLYDRFGNLNLLHRDSDISCETPIPLKPRPKPPVVADCVDWNAPKTGTFAMQNVYRGLGDVPPGSVARLRIVGVLPKVQPFMNQPVLSVSAEDTGKFILGTVPVEPDGSAYFTVPSGMSFFFQALDRNGMALRTMRSLTYVQPGRAQSCVGCHESRQSAPVPGGAGLALRRAPSMPQPEMDGTWPLRFDRLVQPVLDRACVECHRPGFKNPKAAAIDLTPEKSYDTLINHADKDLFNLVFEKNSSEVGDCPTRKSKLFALISAEGGHEGVRLDASDLDRFRVWMDTYAHRQGAFSGEQEAELVKLRETFTATPAYASLVP